MINNVKFELVGGKIRIYNPYGFIKVKIKYANIETEISLTSTLNYSGFIGNPTMIDNRTARYSNNAGVIYNGFMNIYPAVPNDIDNILVVLKYEDSSDLFNVILNSENGWHWHNERDVVARVQYIISNGTRDNFNTNIYMRNSRNVNDNNLTYYVDYASDTLLNSEIVGYPLNAYGGDYVKIFNEYSIECVLYKNSSEKNRVDKTTYLTEIVKYNITFKNSFSLTNPTILIQAPMLINVNYAHIPILGRYYYIESISNIASNLWQLDLIVDTVMSFKNEIQELDCFIDRCEDDNYNDILIKDDLYPIKNAKSIELKYLTPLSTPINTSDIWEMDFSDWGKAGMPSVVMKIQSIVRGDDAGTVSLPMGGMSQSVFSNIPYIGTPYAISRALEYISDANWTQSVQWLSTNPTELVCGVIAFPIPIGILAYQNGAFIKTKRPYSSTDVGSERDFLYIGHSSYSLELDYPDKNVYDEYGFIKFDPDRGIYSENGLTTILRVGNWRLSDYMPYDFLELEPYGDIELFIPTFGYVKIDISAFVGLDVNLTIDVDILTGKAIAEIYAGSKRVHIFEWQMGVEVPITLRNGAEVARNQLMAGINTVTSLVSLATFGIGFGAASHRAGRMVDTSLRYGTDMNLAHADAYSEYVNKMGAATMAGRAANTAGSTAASIIASSVSKYQTGTVKGSMLSYTLNTQPHLKITTFKKNILRGGSEYQKYKHLIGIPSKSVTQLKNIQGFTKVAGVHMDGFTTALPNEVDEIEELLKTGVIL